ncbi:MAG TPA: hypothetical protein VJV23_04950 [Candidatus Polarisedimenticolia bacterium]|nr:hypothetical protein [Candidatus Polarisedimenticolia bacterium]
MPRNGSRATISLAVGLFLSHPLTVQAAPLRWELDAGVAAGIDTNPLELSREALPAAAIPSGAFTEASAGGRLTGEWSPRAGWFTSVEGSGRFHPASFDEADSAQGRVEAGLGFILWSEGERRLSAALRGFAGAERSTFVDPATGGLYLAGDPNAPVPIPDRFDRDATGAALGLRLRTSARLLLLLDSRVSRDDHTQDYDGVPDIDALDSRSLLLRPGARWNITDSVRLDVIGEWAAVHYDELPSLDSQGSPAEDEPRRYVSRQVRASLSVEPSARWSFLLGGSAGRRDDVHAGYYDALAESAQAGVVWSPLEGLRASLRMAQSQVDFSNATVGAVADGEPRGGDVVTVAGSIEKDLFERLTVRAEAARVSSSNRDPLYTYDRSWALVGLRYSH